MNIEGKQIWQVPAGDGNRDYAGICLEWDVILESVGGREGPWPGWLQPDSCWEHPEPSRSARASDRITEGDLVVLYVGRQPAGVGQVAGGAFWHEEFGEIDGRRLSRVWRVWWLWKGDGISALNAKSTFTGPPAIQPLASENVLAWLARLKIDEQALERPLTELPEPEVSVAWSEIETALFEQGLAGDAVRQLAVAREAVCRLAQWYHQTSTPVSEGEAATNLVTPLLRGLGWPAQRMGIEWNSVGVALYTRPERRDEHLAMVIEIRHGLQPCLRPQSQARFYAEELRPSEACDRLVITDGMRYGVFLKENGRFAERPHAYLNLSRMRRSCPILGCHGAPEAVRLLAPLQPAGSVCLSRDLAPPDRQR